MNTSTKTKSIVQPWVTQLGLRHQGVLLTAIRGCDGMVKEDSTKPLAREFRGLILTPFDIRELDHEKGFMVGFPSMAAEKNFYNFQKSLDHYPVHYIFHLIHAIEIIGYYHPYDKVKETYISRYKQLVKRLHLQPESKKQLDKRLNEDRIKNNSVES